MNHARGHQKTANRLLIHIAGLNLGVLMRALFDMGTPRGLQGPPSPFRRRS